MSETVKTNHGSDQNGHPFKRVLVLGLGLMGAPIALRLIESGYEVTGWNRGFERAEAARELGVVVNGELKAAVDEADLLILTLSDASAIQSTLDDLDLTGKIVLQMGTIGPSESRAIAQQVSSAGGDYLEAPVLGSIPEAKTGKLIIMAGGEEALYQRCLPVLKVLGEAPERVGTIGQGAALKLAMNQLIASLTAGFSLSLGLVRSEGLDVETFMGLLRNSALYAPTFDKKLGKMLAHDYANPNFPLKHLIKDVELFRRVAEENGIDSSLLTTMKSIFEKGSEAGFANEDYSALYEAINPISEN